MIMAARSSWDGCAFAQRLGEYQLFINILVQSIDRPVCKGQCRKCVRRIERRSHDLSQRNATDDGMLLRLPERSLGVPWGWRVAAPASREGVHRVGASV